VHPQKSKAFLFYTFDCFLLNITDNLYVVILCSQLYDYELTLWYKNDSSIYQYQIGIDKDINHNFKVQQIKQIYT